MSDIVSEAEIDLTDPSVVDRLLNNKDLRKLPVGSDEFKAAARESLAKMDETTDESAVTEEEVNNTESEEPQEDYAEEDSENQSDVKPKKTRGMLKRIETLVAEREELKRRLQEVEAQKAQFKQSEVEENATEDQYGFNKPKPQLKNFDTIEEYTEALTDWKLEKKEYEYTVQREQSEIEKTAKEIATTWEQKEKAVKEQYPDYSKLVNIDSLVTVNPSVEAKVYLAEMDNGPLVLYKLLSDDSALEKFMDATPTRQVALLAKIESQLGSSDEQVVQKKATITRAPEPVKALPKGKAVVTTKDIYNPDLSFEEYNRLMDERERARKGR